MQDIISAFRKHHLFSKEELIQSFKLTMKHIRLDEDCTEESRQAKLQLCDKFLIALKKCKLPELTEPWWFYEYEFTGDAIELNLCSADGRNMELDEDGFINGMVSSLENTLLRVECEYITVEQFANIQSVKPAKVQQWIRHGKLRNARKNGETWLIPSIEDKPSDEYGYVQYLIEDPIEIDEFPFITSSDSVSIHKDLNDATKYICYFEDFNRHLREHIILNRKEVERLEFAIISSGKAKSGSTVQYVPDFKH